MWKKIVGSLILALGVGLLIYLLKYYPPWQSIQVVVLVSGINMCAVWGTLLITGIHI